MVRSYPVLLTTSAIAAGSGMFWSSCWGLIAPFVRQSVELRDGVVGLLAGGVFLVAYVVAYVVPALLRLLGLRGIGLLHFISTVVSLALVAGAQSPARVVIGVLVGSVGVAICFPFATQLSAFSPSPERRAMTVGVTNAASQGGAILLGLQIYVLGLDWRTALLFCCLLPLAGAAAVAGALRGTAPAAPDARPRGEEAAKPHRGLALYSFTCNGAIIATATYLPLYSVESAGLSPEVGALMISTIGLLGVASKIAWARLLGRRAPVAVARFIAAGSALSAVALLAGGGRAGPVLWIGVFGMGVTAIAWAVPVLVAAAGGREGEAGARAAAVLRSGFIGAVLVPPIFGGVVEGLGYPAAWSALAVSLLCVAYVVGAVPSERAYR